MAQLENQESNVVIKVENVAKTFARHSEKNSIKTSFVNLFKDKAKISTKDFHVLKDVSFEVNKGDFFGIVGRNGSGKSTLLKIIAEIYRPTSGNVSVHGSLVPFIELGVGFNPELTGRENVYLNGALLGFSRKEMEDKYDDIVKFAELEQYMDEKLKNYSSGMQVRLAFSVAIRADGDILVLDEVLAVGDEAFQRKCNDYFKQLKKDGKTVILVTHSMENVRKYCNKAMLIQDGRVKMIGNPDMVADEYYGINLLEEEDQQIDGTKPYISAKIVSKRLLHPIDTLEMEITYRALDDRPVFAKAYIDLNGQAIMATNPQLLGWDSMITADTEEHIAKYTLPLSDFNKGEYQVIALIEDVESGVNLASFGYAGETTIKIENLDKASSGGILTNKARMEL